jgi:cell division protein FtsL
MPQTARRGTHRAPPRHARRVSGPARPVARAVPAVALPEPRRRAQTSAFDRLLALPHSRFVDRLLRGRIAIWLIAIMLGGIVTMQVSLLKLNAGISHDVEAAGALERVNADLETEVAKLSSGERIQQAAAEEGMVPPPAGDVGYLRSRPGVDPSLAAHRMQAPSAEARDVMANGGHAAAALVPPAIVDPAAPTTTTTTVAPAATTVAPAATATPVPAATAVPPAPTATPAPTVAPAATTTG